MLVTCAVCELCEAGGLASIGAVEGISQTPALPGNALPTRGEVCAEQMRHPAMRKLMDFLIKGELATEYASMGTDEKRAFRESGLCYELSRDGLLMRRCVFEAVGSAGATYPLLAALFWLPSAASLAHARARAALIEQHILLCVFRIAATLCAVAV